eukprot:9488573-Pyramimonas_sp.AAC.1
MRRRSRRRRRRSRRRRRRRGGVCAPPRNRRVGPPELISLAQRGFSAGTLLLRRRGPSLQAPSRKGYDVQQQMLSKSDSGR